MSNIFKIYKDNEDTFYNYNSGNKVRTVSRKLAEAIFALLLSFIYFDFSNDLINGIICVYAILAGFGLNILFFLMGTDARIKSEPECSIERRLKIDKTNTLSKELFFNVSYFIAVCVLLILLCLVYYLFDSSNKWLIDASYKQLSKLKYATTSNIHCAKLIVNYIFKFSIILFLLESIYTFSRTIFRVCFYFDQRLNLQNPKV